MDEDVKQLLLGFQAQIAALTEQNRVLTEMVGRMGPQGATAAIPTRPRQPLLVSRLWALYYPTFEAETWATSVRDLMKWALKHFADREVTEMRRSDWAFYRDQICRKRITRLGAAPSVTTRNMELVRFKTMLNWAVDQELIDANPLARVKKERGRPARETVIGDEGLEKLLSFSNVLLRAFILIAIDSGMRKSEVRNLKWSQIEDSGRVRISWTVAKTKRSRSARLSERALDAIDELPRSVFSQYVFANSDTGLPFGKTYFWDLFRSACADAKLEAAEGDGNVHYHDTRHTHITRSIQNGNPMVVVMRASGHVTLSQASRYMHVDETDLDLMKAKNDEAIAAGPRRPPARAAREFSTRRAKNNEG
jgi:integrase